MKNIIIYLSVYFSVFLEYLKIFYLYIKRKFKKQNFFLLAFILILNIFVIFVYKEYFGIENNKHYLIINIIPRFSNFIINFLFENKKDIILKNFNLVLNNFKIRLIDIFKLENILINILNFSSSFFLRNEITKSSRFQKKKLSHNFFLVVVIVLVNIINRNLINFIFLNYRYYKK